MRFSTPAPPHDLTYSDVFLVPSRSSITSRLDVDLTPRDGTGTTIPIVSANMNSVTGPRLAVTLARRGGLGVLPQDLAIDQTAAAIRRIKEASPIWDEEFDPRDPRLADVDFDAVPTIDAASARDAFDQLVAGDHAVARVASGGTTTLRSALRGTLYAPAIDANGRLLVAAAIGINGDVVGRARALVAAGVDVLVLDTAHGHQEGMLRALAAVDGIAVPVVAGNVVTAEGVNDLVAAGADIVKVGVGPGAMCTTRMMTAVGRPQFSAVLDTVEAARELGAHIWADGGVRYPRDVALALAAGAASVMIGSWFAGTIESPGDLEAETDGRLFKRSWGMASTKAVHARFNGLDPYELSRKELFAEGISSSRIYLDPARPSVEDLLDSITAGLRSSFTYAGAARLGEFHERAVVGVQSAAGYEEGKALPVSW